MNTIWKRAKALILIGILAGSVTACAAPGANLDAFNRVQRLQQGA